MSGTKEMGKMCGGQERTGDVCLKQAGLVPTQGLRTLLAATHLSRAVVQKG